MNGKIIKGGIPDDPSSPQGDASIASLARDRQVLKGDIVTALDSADRIIKDAQDKAANILAAARKQEQEILAGAKEKGYEEGLASLNETILKFKDDYSLVLKSAEKDLLSLSLKIAERIIGQALDLDPALLLEIIETALQSIKYQREIRIRVHPEQVSFLKENKTRLYALVGESKNFEIVGDPTVLSEGCIIDTEIGSVDARLETQLRVLEKILIKA